VLTCDLKTAPKGLVNIFDPHTDRSLLVVVIVYWQFGLRNCFGNEVVWVPGHLVQEHRRALTGPAGRLFAIGCRTR